MKCEICNAKAHYFCYFKNTKKWLVTCATVDHDESYYISIKSFFYSEAATVDWLAHMSEKIWFIQSTESFFQMFHRYRAEMRYFGALVTAPRV